MSFPVQFAYMLTATSEGYPCEDLEEILFINPFNLDGQCRDAYRDILGKTSAGAWCHAYQHHCAKYPDSFVIAFGWMFPMDVTYRI